MSDSLADVINRVPGWAGQTWTSRSLPGGITNRNELIDINGSRFVLRLAGKDTDLLGIDRGAERAASEQAASLGLAPEVVAFIEPEGYLVTRFIEAEPVTVSDMATPRMLEQVGATLRTLHASEPIPGEFNCFEVPKQYRMTAESRHVAIPPEYWMAARRPARSRLRLPSTRNHSARATTISSTQTSSSMRTAISGFSIGSTPVWGTSGSTSVTSPPTTISNPMPLTPSSRRTGVRSLQSCAPSWRS